MYTYEAINTVAKTLVSNTKFSDVGDLAFNGKDVSDGVTADQISNRGAIIVALNEALLKIYTRFEIASNTMVFKNPKVGEQFDIPLNYVVGQSAVWNTGVNVPLEGDSNVLPLVITRPSPLIIKLEGTGDFLTIDPTDYVTLTYQVSHSPIEDLSTFISISPQFFDALYNFTAYLLFASISSKIDAENNTYYLRFSAECNRLERTLNYEHKSVDYGLKLGIDPF
jgi:hypothetical protein